MYFTKTTNSKENYITDKVTTRTLSEDQIQTIYNAYVGGKSMNSLATEYNTKPWTIERTILTKRAEVLGHNRKTDIKPFINQIKQLAKDGKSINDIAFDLGFSNERVRLVIKEDVLKTEFARTDIDREKLIELFKAEPKLNNDAIALELGCSSDRIAKLRTHFNNDTLSIVEQGIDRAKLIEMLSQGVEDKVIAEQLGCSSSRVRTLKGRYNKENGIETNRKVIDHKLVKRLHESGKSAKEISEEVGCTLDYSCRLLRQLKG